MIEIGSAAIAEIKRIQSNSSIPNSSLRLSVKSGGCCGLFYQLELEELKSTQVKSTTPDNKPEEKCDRLIELAEITLKVDEESWQYIEHLKLDYSEDLMGGGFRFNNPQIKQSCGCGISFAPQSKIE